MNIALYNSIYIISNLFGTYIVYKFMGVFFNRDEVNKKMEFLTYLIYFLVTSTTYIALNIPILTLIINLVLFFALSFNYKASLKNRIFAVFFMYIILASIETIIALLTGYIYDSILNMNLVYYSIVGMISIKVFSYIVILLIENYKTRKTDIDIPIIHWVSTFLIPLGSLYIIINLMQSSNLNSYSIVVSISIILAINIIAFYLYDVLSKMYEDKIEKTMLKEQNKYYQSQLNILDNTNKNTKSIRHDLKNHIHIVRKYIQIGEKEKAIDYLNQMNEQISGDKKLSKSGNMDIDSILNYKLNEAIKRDIPVSIESKIPSDLNISSLDIVVILGNLLDNAIESSSKVDKNKEIDVKMRYQNNILFIHIENTFNNNIAYEEEKIKTSKKDEDNHGIGLKNVERILKRYNGLMNIHHKDDKFTTDIIMYVE